MPTNSNLPARCEDYPCCGHTDGLPCNWVAPDYSSDPHVLCDHENGFCEVEPDDDDDDDDGLVWDVLTSKYVFKVTPHDSEIFESPDER